MKQMTKAQETKTRQALALFNAFLKSDIYTFTDGAQDKQLTDVIVLLTNAFPDFKKWWNLPEDDRAWVNGTVEKEFFSVFSYGEALFDFVNAVYGLKHKQKSKVADVGLSISYAIEKAVDLHDYVRHSDHETPFSM